MTYKGARGLKVEATNPDEAMNAYVRGKLCEAWLAEAYSFIEEVSVTLRKLKAGKKVTLRSKPIVVELERTP